jgi:hypothetical protein
MSKKDTTEEKKSVSGELVPRTDVNVLARQAQATAALQGKDQMRALEDALGLDSAEVEVIAGGKLPFWPAYAGAIIVGTIQSRREVETRWKSPQNPNGIVGLYTVLIQKRPCLAGTLDGEVFELQPGDSIQVLERSVLKELQFRIGQQVGILCVGKVSGKQFNYWDYRIVGERRSAEQVQAAAQMAMAQLQTKQLSAKNEQ